MRNKHKIPFCFNYIIIKYNYHKSYKFQNNFNNIIPKENNINIP